MERISNKTEKKIYQKWKKLLSNIKIIFFVKNDWQNGSYEIKDNEIRQLVIEVLGVEET